MEKQDILGRNPLSCGALVVTDGSLTYVLGPDDVVIPSPAGHWLSLEVKYFDVATGQMS